MDERPFKTTFFADFTIADVYWLDAIRDTYKRAFTEWKSDYKYLTELVIALNRKMFEHYQKWHMKFAQLYQDLFQLADDYAIETLKDDELSYFLNQTD